MNKKMYHLSKFELLALLVSQVIVVGAQTCNVSMVSPVVRSNSDSDAYRHQVHLMLATTPRDLFKLQVSE